MDTETLRYADKAIRLAIARELVKGCADGSRSGAVIAPAGSDTGAQGDSTSGATRGKGTCVGQGLRDAKLAIDERAATDVRVPIAGFAAGAVAAHAAARSGSLTEGREARAGVVRISQSAVIAIAARVAKAMMPGQCSGGMRLRAAHARAFTGRVSTSGAAATRAAPPSAAMSEA